MLVQDVADFRREAEEIEGPPLIEQVIKSKNGQTRGRKPRPDQSPGIPR